MCAESENELTSSLVFPGTGTGAERSRKIHVSISLTSDMMDEGMFILSGIGEVRSVHTQSLDVQKDIIS